jgi:hypothetical protein
MSRQISEETIAFARRRTGLAEGLPGEFEMVAAV